MLIVLAILVGVLIVAVVASAVLVVRSMDSDEDPQAGGELLSEVGKLVTAQQTLTGHVEAVSKNQLDSSRALTESFGKSQSQLGESLADRLNKVEATMNKNLASSAKDTAESLAGLNQRLETIDKAQDNIKTLSEQVVSLQHVLDDNPARGAFGEMQLADLVETMLPNFAYRMQAPLANGKQVDCLIKLPDPPGPISVDAKFPLVGYQEMLAAPTKDERDKAGRKLAQDTIKHIRDIADRYVSQKIDDSSSTADHALMFLPSEAVYGELHAHHPGVIEESHRRKVYLVSPTTLMSTLTTVRAILRDVEMRKQASVIQTEVGTLLKDVGRLNERVTSLDRHFDQASRDISDIKISTGKIVSRSDKIEALDLGEHDDQQPALESGE